MSQKGEEKSKEEEVAEPQREGQVMQHSAPHVNLWPPHPSPAIATREHFFPSLLSVRLTD